MKPDLIELLNQHASDKHSQNSYGPIYHALFKARRYEAFTLLEIGIGTVTPGAHSSMYGHDLPGYRPGASLRAWRDYFEHACIVGFDVQPDTMIVDEPRIETHLVDSTKTDQVAQVLLPNSERFRIIIDDGSHLVPHQLASLRNLWPHLAAGHGLYIIEDVNRLDLNQPRLGYGECRDELLAILGDNPYFFVSRPKADMLIVSKL